MPKKLSFRKSAGTGFTKFNDDRMQAFGWANIFTKGDDTFFDSEGQGFLPEDIEPAAYQFVKDCGAGSESHGKLVSSLIESNCLTYEKQEQMGVTCLDADNQPFEGWWVGYQFYDEGTWARVKNDELGMFSVHGVASHFEDVV